MMRPPQRQQLPCLARWSAMAALGMGPVLLASGCTPSGGPLPAIWPGSPLDPRSPQAEAISNLTIIVFVLAALVFLIVEAALFVAVFRFRERPGGALPRQVTGHRNLEIGWTIAPVVLLVIVFALMAPLLNVIHPPSAESAQQPLRVTVVGNQWWWEYQYPDLNIVTANELHIPVGVPVELTLESDDVIHSYWVPQLNGKLDVIPGRPNRLLFEAREPGVYGGQCAEFCGIQHAWMLVPVFAQTEVDFAAWVQAQQQPAAPPNRQMTAIGQEVFLSKTCVNCHTVRGTPAEGEFGPDLTHFGSRATIGTGVLSNKPENLALWISDIQTVKPGARMPNFDLSDNEMVALVAYLESLR